LRLVCALIAGNGGDELAWAEELDERRKAALTATVCRLQAGQISRAAAEFTGAVGDLKARLETLSREAAAASGPEPMRATAMAGSVPTV